MSSRSWNIRGLYGWIPLALALAGTSIEAAETIDVGENPESLTRGFEGKYFITLMGPTRIPCDGNGSIVVLEDKMPKMFCDGMDDPKGIIQMGDFLITADFTRVWKILAADHRTADGIGHDQKGRFYVSEVGTGKVWRYESDGSGKTSLAEGLVSAADLLVDEKAGILIVPDTKAGKIIMIGL